MVVGRRQSLWRFRTSAAVTGSEVRENIGLEISRASPITITTCNNIDNGSRRAIYRRPAPRTKTVYFIKNIIIPRTDLTSGKRADADAKKKNGRKRTDGGLTSATYGRP